MAQTTRRAFLAFSASLAATPVLTSISFADGHADHIVEIKGHSFSPANLVVKAGETVEFINRDGAPHTATADNGAFDTGRLGRNDVGMIKIDAAGTYGYFCAVHPNMRGEITVEA
ncbi:MAG: cupredoxin family copper-binding protein [Pseudomonadota bacterium]